MVLLVTVVAVYGYVIVLSLWAMRVQRAAAMVAHHPHDHPAVSHLVERNLHGDLARVLIVSFAVRLAQLSRDFTPWLVVPLTILVALLTMLALTIVRRMAIEDLYNWHIGLLNKVKTVALLMCTAGLFIDQVWRIVTLFWF
ncbi:MAG TPA: hypothetical protein VGS97_15670 [Actinocrinis sp.]|uniref:hypothetical protein n=1 Tax=Actinocrinis sp. TaxID=1920516 RepID=UPI002DDCBBF0|nr:hypothetical protein [Actinocrinis sp.]HEV2345537.1 hypothetical protein [Actinocrinis sp.]